MSSEKHRPLARGDACQVCKKRKVRCPGEKPACSRCVRLNKICDYVNPSDPSSSSSPAEALRASFSSTQESSIPTPFTFNEDVPFDNIINYLSVDPRPVTASSSSGPPSVEPLPADLFGLFPKANNAVPELPSGWNWDWSTVDLAQLLGQPHVDEPQLSDNDRDHLLLLFFSNFNLFGMMVYFPTFYTNIHSANPADHPHPCLLYAMFLVSCHASNLDYIRAKEELFYRKAREEMERALRHSRLDTPHLYDTARAGILIALWLFFKDSHVEAWVMLGQATRLAITCGLDRLPSSTWISTNQGDDWSDQGRNRESSLPKPKSRIELGERICAFWCLFLLDRCASAAMHFTAGFDAERVTTPLPRPWAEYEDDAAHGPECDTVLKSLFQAKAYASCGLEHRTEYVHLIQSVVLMHAASLDNTCDPKIETALRQFVQDLAPDWKQPVTDVNGSKLVPTGTASLQFIILGTEMYMKGADMRALPNPEVLGVVRRMLGVLTLLRDKNLGDHSVFITTIWTKMARILLIESKRLERDGDTFGAASLDQDVDFVVGFLRLFRQGVVQNAVQQLGRWRLLPVAEFFQEQLDPVP